MRDTDRPPFKSASGLKLLAPTVLCAVALAAAPPAEAQTEGPAIDLAAAQAEASVYTAIPVLQRLHGRALIDTLHGRVGEEEQLRHSGSLNDAERVDGAWTRLIGWTGEQDGDGPGLDGAGEPELDWDLYGLQLGLELYRNRDPGDDEEVDDDEAERHHAGVTFAIASMDGEVQHNGAALGRNTGDAYSLGGYWTKFGEQGGYLDAILQATWYDYDAQPAQLPAISGDGFGAAVSVEIGKPFDLERDRAAPLRGWLLEPQGQLIYQVFDERGAEDAVAPVAFQDTESLLGRLGLRLANSWMNGPAEGPRMSTIWGRINAWYELMDPLKIVFSSAGGVAPVTADSGERWIELNGGVTAQLSRSGAIYADVGYLWDTTERGDALHGRIGARWNW